MIRKYHNHKLQTTPWHREEEPLNHHETPNYFTITLMSPDQIWPDIIWADKICIQIGIEVTIDL